MLHTVTCAASTSRKRNSEFPCLVQLVVENDVEK
jgi:hypothetical protein